MKKKPIRRALAWCAAFLAVGTGAVGAVDLHVKATGERQIVTAAEAASLPKADCILVLGCMVYEDGTPCAMLADRLQCGVELFESGVAPKLLMSGDHGRTAYNEVAAMKRYAMNAGVDSSDIFMDHAGFSTYESLYRAKEVFGAERIVIVTQRYHLSRALYVAESLGLEAWGVACDRQAYWGQFSRDCREVLARVKDFGTSLFKPRPTFLGETISLQGSGDVTNDEFF